MSPGRGSYPDTWRIPDLSEPRYSQSLERGLAILECFSRERPVLGIAEIADLLGMSRSTTHRYVSTLAALGHLRQGAQRKYRLGLGVTSLGMSALNAMGLREHAHADLLELRTRAVYTTSLAVLDGPEIVYVDHLRSLRGRQAKINPGLQAGSRLPAYCTAMGKVLLAHTPKRERQEALADTTLARRGPNAITSEKALRAELKRVLQEGVAVEDQECMSGLIAIAAPVRNEANDVIAAIDLSTHTSRITVEDLADALHPHLVSTANRISARLGYRRGEEALISA